MKLSLSKLPPGIFLGGALIISAVIFGSFYYFAQFPALNDELSVTGSAKKTVTSDQVKLVLAMVRNVSVSELSFGNEAIARDLKLVNDLLSKNGIPQAEIVTSPVFMDQAYDPNPEAGLRYNLRQTVTIQSSDVSKITELSKAVPSLASQGAVVSAQALEYYYSKLPELRVALLSDAVKDAQARAAKIVENTGKKVGNIHAATSGVVQVLPSNSVEVSDYGSYDTGSIEKDVMVTVKASFGLK